MWSRRTHKVCIIYSYQTLRLLELTMLRRHLLLELCDPHEPLAARFLLGLELLRDERELSLR